MEKFRFSVGALHILVSQHDGGRMLSFDPAMAHFAVKEEHTPDISYEISGDTSLPDLQGYVKIFDTQPEGLWTIYRNPEQSGYLIILQNDPHGPPLQVALADNTFSNFQVFPGERKDFGFWYPFDEMTIAAHANMNRVGIIVHAACVEIDGKGYLFAGTSGAGKSTLSELWMSNPAATVITDERVLIRLRDGRLWAYGTPWHGTAQIHKNIGVPLTKVFFIKHGQNNCCTDISRIDAVNRLMVRCFPTFWHKAGMQFVVDLCHDIASRVECRQLEFVPDQSVLHFILEE